MPNHPGKNGVYNAPPVSKTLRIDTASQKQHNTPESKSLSINKTSPKHYKASHESKRLSMSATSPKDSKASHGSKCSKNNATSPKHHQASPASTSLSTNLPSPKQEKALAKRRKSVPMTAHKVHTPRSQCAIDLTEVSAEVWLITKLAAQLLWAFRVSSKWIIMLLKLLSFVSFLLPAFLRIFYFWLFSPRVQKNIRYGTQGRNLLDIYLVPHPVVLLLDTYYVSSSSSSFS
jgi:hypothetical protein